MESLLSEPEQADTTPYGFSSLFFSLSIFLLSPIFRTFSIIILLLQLNIINIEEGTGSSSPVTIITNSTVVVM